MASEKNDSITSTKIKSVSVKRRIVQPSAAEPAKTAAAEPEKTIEKLPKKSKLAVRVVGRDLKSKEKEEVVEEKAEKKEKKSEKTGKDYFHRVSHRLEEAKPEVAHHKGKKHQKRETVSRPVGVYRKISIFFILLTLALLAAAFYFFIVSLTIEVTPKTERTSDKLNIKINNGAVTQGANLSGSANINGSVEQIPVKEQQVFSATGANILGQEIIGKVTIINNYSQDKTLVATTRLLSPDGKLFRIKNQVNIPTGSSVAVDIYADDPSQDMAIGPTTFTIPGLPAMFQTKIYAKSATAFVYQSDVQKFVQDIDIQKATQDIKESLLKKVNSQFSSNYKGFDKVLVQIDKNSLTPSSTVKVGAKIDSFTVSLTAMVDIVAFQTADVKKLAVDRLSSTIPPVEKFVGLNQDEIQYNLIDGDFKNGTANIEVPIVGTMSLSDVDNAVDKTMLVGLSASQINLYLQSLNKFSDVKLFFTPPFINKAPSLVDRIKIVIKR